MNKNNYLFISLLLIISSSFSQTVSKFLVVDQFGYRTNAQEKIAVIRNPVTGFDSGDSFSPGTTYALVNATNDSQVYTSEITAWNNGEEDPSSGDKTWWFDFGSVTTDGEYYVLDLTNNVKSYNFEIRNDIYNEVLKHAVRTFYYQRVGFAKEMPYAEFGWTDGASHIGPLQDKQCRSYDKPNDASTERDLSGGWYDAGDYNKYTTWTANYIYEMVQAYDESPTSWTDDYDLPESGNGVADILDEAKWGMDHLLKLQKTDGSMISVVDESHASPPSSATGQSLYGAVNTSSTLASAGAFAYGAKVFRAIGMSDYANTLENAAESAWNWADANPDVIWRNNDEAFSSKGIGSGQQEVDDYGRFSYKMRASVHLNEITNNDTYKTYFESNYQDLHLFTWTYAYPYEVQQQETLLYYTTLDNATSTVKTNILNRYKTAMEGENNLPNLEGETDSYGAHMDSYTWGSNGIKAQKGNMFFAHAMYLPNNADSSLAIKGAERYIHYIHGINPLNIVYLTNMGNYGAENSADQIYHTWFHDGSSLWDQVGVSTYGPAPGFVPGGPNVNYDVDGCCSSSCGSTANTAKCTSLNLTPPKDQPKQKSYANFNSDWPVNSWSVTENSGGYQMRYIRLLSKFVQKQTVPVGIKQEASNSNFILDVFPNPSNGTFTLSNKSNENISLTVVDSMGNVITKRNIKPGNTKINLNNLSPGAYLLRSGESSKKIMIK